MTGIPNIIVIGVPDTAALERVRAKLHGADVGYVCWEEPDFDLGFTSIATQPMGAEEKKFLQNYRLWQPVFRGSSNAEQPVPNPDREMLVRAQPPEPVMPS